MGAALCGLDAPCARRGQCTRAGKRSGPQATLAWYEEKLGFRSRGTWLNPPVYAIVGRDQHAIHFRCAEPPAWNADKYSDELLDAYVSVEDVNALHAEYAARGVEFTRELDNMPWGSREFVVKDCDGRLLAFGANL